LESPQPREVKTSIVCIAIFVSIVNSCVTQYIGH